MSLDQIHYKKIKNLEEEILQYINTSYLQEIREDKLENLMEKWNKKNDMLDKIAISLAIEGNFKIKNISKEKLNKEINIVLFEEHIEEALDILKKRNLKVGTKEKININVDRKKLEVMIKDYLRKNIREIFNEDINKIKGTIIVNNEEELKVIKIH
ncbi:MAG: hypothetical protein ACRDAU_13895 [Clostridium sp.]